MARRASPFEPLRPLARGPALALGALFFALFVAAWGVATWGGFVKPLFLADPARTLRAGVTLFADNGYAADVAVTVGRVLGGFLIAALIGVPLGVLMGAYKPVDALLAPFVSFARYLPASAFIPLLILWAGIGEAQKLLLIVIGSVFQVVVMVAVAVGSTRRDLVEASYTLGATHRTVVTRVLLPHAAPQVAEALRLVLGWAWTYVIVAELVGADSGIGHRIMDSQRFLDTGQMIFGIVVIGLIGLVSDAAVVRLNRALFPWALAGR